LRVSAADEVLGLDASQHNEKYFQGSLVVHQNGKVEDTLIDVNEFSEVK